MALPRLSPAIMPALILASQWNDVEVVYETIDSYVLFSWGTSA